ncbi:MAG: 2-oxo acid dehydrogenase subunit E2 [Gemmatimonadales bacterium]
MSFDHRIIDGAVADEFLAFVKKSIESFPESGI